VAAPAPRRQPAATDGAPAAAAAAAAAAGRLVGCAGKDLDPSQSLGDDTLSCYCVAHHPAVCRVQRGLFGATGAARPETAGARRRRLFLRHLSASSRLSAKSTSRSSPSQSMTRSLSSPSTLQPSEISPSPSMVRTAVASLTGPGPFPCWKSCSRPRGLFSGNGANECPRITALCQRGVRARGRGGGEKGRCLAPTNLEPVTDRGLRLPLRLHSRIRRHPQNPL